MTVTDVELRELAASQLAVIRRTAAPAERSKVVPECCGLVWNALKAQGIRGGRHVAIYWIGERRIEVGAEVDRPFKERHSMVRSATPAGLVAVATHLGPYGGLAAAHAVVQDWCHENGHRIGSRCWEIYGHWMDEWNANPALIRTDVCYELLRG